MSRHPAAPDARASRRAAICAVLLSAVALAARLVGAGHLLPHTVEPDAVIVGQATTLDNFWAGRVDSPVHNPVYPLLLAGALAALPGQFAAGEHPDAELEAHLAAASEPYRQARLLVAILGALVVPLTFLLARRFLEPGWALFAAALAATSLSHMWYGQQARPHVPLGTIALAAVLAIQRMTRLGTPGARITAGACMALSLACLQTGALVFAPWAVSVVLELRAGRRSPWLLVPLLIGLAALPLAYPALTLTESEQPEIQRLAGNFFLSGHPAMHSFDGSGFSTIASFLWEWDPVLVVLSAAGAVLGCRLLLIYYLSIHALRATNRKVVDQLFAAPTSDDVGGRAAPHRGTDWLQPRAALRRGTRPSSDLVLAGAFALPYLLIFGAYSFTFGRFGLPLIPYLACTGALGAREIAGAALARVRAPSGRVVWRAAAVLLLLGLPTAAALKLCSLRCAPDTMAGVAAWLDEHADPDRDTIFASSGLSLPLLQVPRLLGETQFGLLKPWERYQALKQPNAGTGRGWRIDSPLRGVQLENGRRLVDYMSADSLKRALIERRPTLAVVDWSAGDESSIAIPAVCGEPVFAQWPRKGEPNGDRLFGYDEFGMLNVLRADSLGPGLSIHRVPQ